MRMIKSRGSAAPREQVALISLRQSSLNKVVQIRDSGESDVEQTSQSRRLNKNMKIFLQVFPCCFCPKVAGQEIIKVIGFS